MLFHTVSSLGQRVGDPHAYTSPEAVEVFKGADTNHDGFLERTEVDHLLQPFDANRKPYSKCAELLY